ncbi:hypothetical protein PAECIP111891_06555 [Paenibacillus allorhizoplanae]|uniref:Uncharacterized protein n=1 Tax=Paenibacillus allorhizoplanae TaxID=2905648 RepID=A0ABN8H9P3_9BACL|nr:hypothetical protein [Paenibacillus allorhizoplanae]CAH1229805.1 hypothetical protein PAECIP111891_06555 [Paenibacillus allorhizoplanae]
MSLSGAVEVSLSSFEVAIGDLNYGMEIDGQKQETPLRVSFILCGGACTEHGERIDM